MTLREDIASSNSLSAHRFSNLETTSLAKVGLCFIPPPDMILFTCAHRVWPPGTRPLYGSLACCSGTPLFWVSPEENMAPVATPAATEVYLIIHDAVCNRLYAPCNFRSKHRHHSIHCQLLCLSRQVNNKLITCQSSRHMLRSLPLNCCLTM